MVPGSTLAGIVGELNWNDCERMGMGKCCGWEETGNYCRQTEIEKEIVCPWVVVTLETKSVWSAYLHTTHEDHLQVKWQFIWRGFLNISLPVVIELYIISVPLAVQALSCWYLATGWFRALTIVQILVLTWACHVCFVFFQAKWYACHRIWYRSLLNQLTTNMHN